MKKFRKDDIGKYVIVRRYYEDGQELVGLRQRSIVPKDELVRTFRSFADKCLDPSFSHGRIDITYYLVTLEMYERTSDLLSLF